MDKYLLNSALYADSDLWIFGVFFGIVIIVVVISTIAHNKARKKRREDMGALAEKISFSYSEKDIEGIPENFSAFQLFNKGHGREAENVLEGEFDGINLKIFDYHYTVSSGRSSHTYYHTVFCAYIYDFSMPKFELRPEGIFDKVGDFLGFKDIDFDSHPDFSNRYFLKGENEEEVRKLFTPKVLEYFEKKQENFVLEAFNDRLLIYSTQASGGYTFEMATDNIPQFYKEVSFIVRIFRDSALTF